MLQIGISLKLYTAVVMIVLLIAALVERRYQDTRVRLFIWMLVSDIVVLLCEAQVDYGTAHWNDERFFAHHVIACVLMVGFYSFQYLFCSYYVSLIEDIAEVSIHRNQIILPVCVAFAFLWCLSAWDGFIYRITSRGFEAGPAYVFGQAGQFIVTGYLLYLIWIHRNKLGGKNVLLLLTCLVLPVSVYVLRLFLPAVTFYTAVILSFSILLIYVYNFWEQRYQLVTQKMQIAEEQKAVTISEIGPHFIYNVLNSIYYLCEKDPPMARKAVGEFSEYLRANLNGLESTDLIPASKELEHVRHYLNLEKMRFGDDLQVVMDIETEDFMLPPLTLQPLVENAVKHGVMQREEGGMVRLVIRKRASGVSIRIEDDGVGFDPAKVRDDKGVHLGIASVEKRLWLMCRGSLEIDSKPGQGTVVIIEIQKPRRVE